MRVRTRPLARRLAQRGDGALGRVERVLVLNHFAVPPGEPGGTRHIEMFSRIPDLQFMIVAANVNPTTRRSRGTKHPDFRFVPVPSHETNGVKRVLGWLIYAGGAFVVSAFRRPLPDVVYASSPHLLAGATGLALSKLWRRPLVLELRDLWPQILVDMGALSPSGPMYRVLAALETLLYKYAKIIVVMAEGSRTYLVERGVHPSKVEFIPNAADPADWVTGESRDACRRRYGFTRRTIVYTGAHGPANGLEQILSAAPFVVDSLDIVLVGDGVSKSHLMAEAQRRRLTNVKFMDPVPKSEMPHLLKAADGGLHCLADVALFRYGVSPNKLFDYMAAGLPVVTNCPGEVTEWVTQAGAGLTCAPNDLSEALQTFAQADDATLAAWGDSGRRHMEAGRTRTQMATRLEQALQRAAKRP